MSKIKGVDVTFHCEKGNTLTIKLNSVSRFTYTCSTCGESFTVTDKTSMADLEELVFPHNHGVKL